MLEVILAGMPGSSNSGSVLMERSIMESSVLGERRGVSISVMKVTIWGQTRGDRVEPRMTPIL